MGKYPVLCKIKWSSDGVEGKYYTIIYADNFAEAGRIIDNQFGDEAYSVEMSFLENGLVSLNPEIYEKIRGMV